MMGWGFGNWGPGAWAPWWMGLMMILNWVLPIALIALAVWFLVPRAGNSGARRSDALEILRQRYARGEISTEEFQRMKEELRK